MKGSRKDSWADQLRGFDYLTFAFMVLPSVQEQLRICSVWIKFLLLLSTIKSAQATFL